MRDILSNAKPVAKGGLVNVDLLIVDNDDTCIRLLTDAGVINLITPKAPNNRGYVLCQWRGYFVVAICFRGHPDQADNGYTCYLMPTATVDMKTASEMAVMMLDLDDVRNVSFRVVDHSPENN